MANNYKTTTVAKEKRVLLTLIVAMILIQSIGAYSMIKANYARKCTAYLITKGVLVPVDLCELSENQSQKEVITNGNQNKKTFELQV